LGEALCCAALGAILLLGAVYNVLLNSLFLHGLVIWTGPVERGNALAAGVAIVGVAVALFRRGAFARRLVVELHQEQSEGEKAEFSVTAGGQVILPIAGDERRVEITPD